MRGGEGRGGEKEKEKEKAIGQVSEPISNVSIGWAQSYFICFESCAVWVICSNPNVFRIALKACFFGSSTFPLPPFPSDMMLLPIPNI